ncbi:MAG TPA: carbohydrate-binding family 9-like protein [Thermoanaerobaculia bacterium]|nr:carbohydrate-binding family 9-like protein [Thermoanaerobaculia bacterium]
MTAPTPRVQLERGRELVLPPLRRATDGGLPRLTTRATLLDDGERLTVRFECEDPEPSATLTARDAPLWQEEVVEVFVAPGHQPPRRYFELELNPLGAVFDAVVDSPRGERDGMQVETAWTCAGLETSVELDPGAGLWHATLAIPWRALARAVPAPADWRLNLCRIDRPSGAPAEFSAWSPTFRDPADFHRPDRFGFVSRFG